MKEVVWILPEGNGERVEFCPLPNEESPITWDSHQHVFSLTAGQTRVVPPARKTHAEIRLEKHKQDRKHKPLLHIHCCYSLQDVHYCLLLKAVRPFGYTLF